MSLPGQEIETETPKNPIEETIKALGRMKEAAISTAERVDNLEKFIQKAFGDGTNSFQQFMSELDEKLARGKNGTSEETKEDKEEPEETNSANDDSEDDETVTAS